MPNGMQQKVAAQYRLRGIMKKQKPVPEKKQLTLLHFVQYKVY